MNPTDDPRITAYALNEMADADRAAFEAELAADPALKAAVEAEVHAIRSLTTALKGELDAEAARAVGMLPMESADPRNVGAASRRLCRFMRLATAAAASVAVAALVGSLMLPSLNRARESSEAGKRRSEERERMLALSMKDEKLNALRTERGSLGPDDARKINGEIADGVLPNVRIVSSRFDSNDSILMPRDEPKKNIPDLLTYPSDWPDVTAVRSKSHATSESYAVVHDNRFLDAQASPLSTFGIDVDTASYSNVRRHLAAGQRPPAEAVRIEELINYFPTHDASPTDGGPFAVRMDVAACPWTQGNRLVRIAIKGKVVPQEQRPPTNLVFLIDVSGSMQADNKLPLVKRSLRKLVGQLGENDRVAIVTYAGSSGLALPSTNASNKAAILAAIDRLESGGSTNGGQGIQLAYDTAARSFIREGSNRVILCTDGDFNVGITDRGQLFDLITEKAKGGVFLNVLGFGTGNIKDDTMEGLADKGNGQYAYIDSDREADKMFVENIAGTLVTIAKDVKLQIEFNPATVKSYRLIGYENRVMAAQEFHNDLKDAGDLGAGHNVVALYEIEPAGQGRSSDPANALKYQPVPKVEAAATQGNTSEWLTLKLRYKAPDAPLEQGTSELIEVALANTTGTSIQNASADMRFAAAVAGFGMLLRESPYRGTNTFATVRELAIGAIGDDPGGHRTEFLNLIDQAERLVRK